MPETVAGVARARLFAERLGPHAGTGLSLRLTGRSFLEEVEVENVVIV